MAYLVHGQRARAAGLLDCCSHPSQVAWRITREAIALRAHELSVQDHGRRPDLNWRQAEAEMFAVAGLAGRTLQ